MTEKKILLVQDENAPFQILKMSLSQAGFAVTTCTSAFDAIDELRTEPADLIVTSARLPDLSGFQLSSLLKTDQVCQRIPIAVVGSEDELADNFWKRACLADLFLARKEVELNEAKAVEKIRILMSTQDGQVDKQALVEYALLPSDVNGRDLVHSLRALLSSLLMERSINFFCRNLVESVGSRVDFMSLYVGYMKRLLACELTGLLVADGDQPWGIYQFDTPVSKTAFEKLLSSATKALGANAEPRLVVQGEIVEKGGASMKSAGTIVIHGANRQVLGMLVVGWFTKQALDEQSRIALELLRTEMQPVFRALHAEQAVKSLQEAQSISSSTDPTTGLYNLEFFIGFLQQQLLFSSRQKLPVGVTLIGVDRFSEINQQFGPEAGDAILASLAKRIATNIRSSDLLARYSGDQFAIALPNTDLNGSQILAEKLRADVESMAWDNNGTPPLKITVSVGCAGFNMQEDASPEGILSDAKIALQSAKKSGRNRVAV